ncbi:hypothetical protein [Bacillus subtilis]|uniref:hypothetical protein n=1 Tax=Bacillus subtilis TaxID=1423 RepID=UPI00084A1DE0|nr:hypothetical protein [Bacillus subtilis]ODV48123.1 hypothetical protein BCM26_04030 [Bacillus subtilis]OJH64070.1 hypothetical protein BOH71_06975 [Bacillus subtilis]GLI90626.1 putative membrane protein YnxB [Bacillus subtilis]
MKKLTIFSGVLGVFFSVLAQLFAVIDDSFTVGNIWFVGVLAGILTMIASIQINKKPTNVILLIISSVLGLLGTGIVYIIPTLFNIILLYKLSKGSQMSQ